MAAAKGKIPGFPTVHVGSLLFVCALLPALLFKGPQIEFFAVTQILLVTWLGWVVLKSQGSGLSIPKTGLALCLSLFWLWLAISLTWSLAPGISVVNFWWVGSLVLVFWLYTLTPDRDALWSHAAAIILVLGLVLALMGIHQVLVLEQQARSVFETRNTHGAFLNLVAVPASAYFLMLMADKGTPRHFPGLLGAVLYILFLAIFLTASRGANLSLFLSMGILVALSLRDLPKRGVVVLLLLMAAAFLSTKISHGELGERLPQLMHDPVRRVLWQSAWDLLKASPWQGIGLGLFFLAYPPLRNPFDSSGGYFAHNDYLQIWIETGLPGLLLLLAVLFAASWLLARALSVKTMSKSVRIELTGLFCGLLAVAGQSLVDFNLYILSIMMISGLVMGRFHQLANRELKTASMRIRFSRLIGKRAFPVIVVLLLLLPALYFVSLGLANSYYDKALAQAREGKLQEADKSLATAERLTPADDRMLIVHADLYRHAIGFLPAEDTAGKHALYEQALAMLDRAQSANPLRGLTYLVRARLYEQNPAFAGMDGEGLAAKFFRLALQRDPRLYQGRMEYVTLLLQRGNREEARQTMEEGVNYYYPDIPELVPFFSLAAKLRREAGDIEQAKVLEDKVAALKKLATGSYFLSSD